MGIEDEALQGGRELHPVASPPSTPFCFCFVCIGWLGSVGLMSDLTVPPSRAICCGLDLAWPSQELSISNLSLFWLSACLRKSAVNIKFSSIHHQHDLCGYACRCSKPFL